MAYGKGQMVAKIIGAFIFCFSLLLSAAPALANDFASFDQRIEVGSNSLLTVQEKIVVDFSSPRHGIYRDLPVNYKTAAGNPFSLRVRILSVTDDNGMPMRHSESRKGEYERLQIGDPDVTVTGRQNYVITYSVSRALLYLPQSDELYWNAIVGEWGNLGLPAKTSVTVVLPKAVATSGIKTRCFTVVGSSDDGGCRGTVSGDGVIYFSAAGTPLTVVADWPKGLVTPPTMREQVRDWFADNGIVFWPVVVFIGMFFLWYKKGRDPRVNQAIVVQYAPPDGVSPAELAALAHSEVGKDDITATIIDLAVRGYLEITETVEASMIGKKTGYLFTLKNPDRRGLKSFEERVLIGIFGAASGAGAQVSLEKLRYKFYSDAEIAKKQMFDSAVSAGWFSKSPTAVRGMYIGAALLYAMAVIFFGRGIFASGPIWFVSMLAPAVIIAVFGYFMPARTLYGTKVYASVLGFKEFLVKADKYRLQWAEKENIFEKYLPYAIALGVVDKWAQAFEDFQNQPPNWYHGTALVSWSPVLFAHSLNSASAVMNATMYAAPSSKGGGGFGGGGFGGGGFGGGGGGSW